MENSHSHSSLFPSLPFSQCVVLTHSNLLLTRKTTFFNYMNTALRCSTPRVAVILILRCSCFCCLPHEENTYGKCGVFTRVWNSTIHSFSFTSSFAGERYSTDERAVACIMALVIIRLGSVFIYTYCMCVCVPCL